MHLTLIKKEIMTAEIVTAKGTMKFDLYEKETPIAVQNFAKLAKSGFYDGVTFHRVLKGFVLQGGDPNTKEGAKGQPGAGGPGYSINCETSAEKQYHDRGVLSMAHRGKNTGGSQFFVCMTRDMTKHLDGVHTCFGKITAGEEVIDEVREGDIIEKVIIQD